MEIKINFNMDNAAFENDVERQTSLILLKIANDVQCGIKSGKPRDLNGNTIGSWEITDTD